MTARVTLQPSGHTFEVENGETILDAALRAGLAVEYRCSNGSCGECRARVVSGRVSETLHFDYVLTQAEKDSNTILLCRSLADSDLVLEAAEAHSVEDIPLQTISTTVSRMERATDDVMVLHLRTPRSKTLRFMAGQHARIELDGLPPRNKSIASCPCNGMLLHIHVRHVPGDEFSEYVFNTLRPREEVRVHGPFGRFVLDEDSRRPIVFLAYETGFAAIKSLIEHAIALELSQPMNLYWVARHEKDHYLANYCRAWQDALDNFRFVPLSGADAMSVPAAPAVTPPDGTTDAAAGDRRLLATAARILEDHPDLGGFDVYLNGPEHLLPPTMELLARAKLPPDRLFVDRIRRS